MQNDSKPFCFLTYHSSLSELWDTTWFSVLENTKVWHDSATQQFLICRKNEFFVWNPSLNGRGASVELYAKVEDIQPSRIIFAKKSLDSDFLAIQHSNFQLTIVQAASKKRWKIEIKSPEENRILNHGIVWAEHAGNSQDLVIATIQGIEMYKVSISRGQCKLSHIIPHRAVGFMYEPSHRVLVLTSRDLSSSTTTLKAYTLPYDIPSDIPKFELPRPHSSSPLTINNHNIGPEDMIATSIYNIAYCIIRQPSTKGFHLLFYGLHNSNSTFTLTHQLVANIFSRVAYSVIDNVVYCHCMEAHTTFIIDIWTNIPLNQIETPIPPAFYEGCSLILEGVPEEQFPVSPASEVDSDRPHPIVGSVSGNKKNISNIIETISSYWNHDVTDVKPPALVPGEGYETVSCDAGDSSPVPSPTDNTSRHIVADCLYSRVWTLFPGSPWVWDPSTYSLYRIRCCLPSLAASTLDAHSIIQFLLCRGLPDLSPKPLSRQPTEDPVVVKRQMLLIMRRVFGSFSSELSRAKSDFLTGTTLSEKQSSLGQIGEEDEFEEDRDKESASWERDGDRELVLHDAEHLDDRLENLHTLVKCFVSTAMSPYIDLVINQRDSEGAYNRFRPYIPPPPTPKPASRLNSFRSMSIFTSSAAPTSSPTQSSDLRKSESWGDTEDFYAVSSNSRTDLLESEDVMHSLLPEILVISKESLLLSAAKALSTTKRSSWSDSLRPILPLVIRRDRNGRLVVTQTEILTHIFLSSLTQASLTCSACITLLMTFFDVLRNPIHPVATSLSGRMDSKNKNTYAIVTVDPAICILLLKLMVADDRLLEITEMMHLKYFPESVDFAMILLESADFIASKYLNGHVNAKLSFRISSSSHVNSSYSSPVISSDTPQESLHRDSSIDLTEAQTSEEAVSEAVRTLYLSALDMLWRLRQRTVVVRWLLSHGRLADAMALCTKDTRGNWPAGLEPPSAVPGIEFYIAATELLNVLPLKNPGKKVEVMYIVCKFLSEWDPELLLVIKASGKSRLASQIAFPEKHFNPRHCSLFKELLGYTHN